MGNIAPVKKPRFSVAIQTDAYKNLINNTLQDPKRAQRFVASISSVVATNPALQECDAATILTGALLGEALNLTPSPQLGQYYLVPFKDNKNDRVVATFVLGYKGYIQLALRSGQYRKLNVEAVKEGELVSFDPFNEEIVLKPILDPVRRAATRTIGYYAMFEYINGFRKAMYWSHEKMLQHASRYSAAFGPAPARGKFPGRVSYDDYLAGKYDKGSDWAYSSFWYKDFDGMAYKTMLRQLISKWGIMSTELQQAFEADNQLVNENGSVEVVDNSEMETTTPNSAPAIDQTFAEDSSEPHDAQSEMSLDDV